AVLAGAVDGESEMRPAGDARGLAAGGAREVPGHLRPLDRRLRDGIPDQMRERDLRRGACRGERGVELAPARVQDVDGDGAKRRRGWDVAAALHVLDERRGGSAYHVR